MTKKYYYDDARVKSANFSNFIKLLRNEDVGEELIEVDKDSFMNLEDYKQILREPKSKKGLQLPSSFNSYIRKNKADMTIGLIFEFTDDKCFVSYICPDVEDRGDCFIFSLKRDGFNCYGVEKAKIMLDIKLNELGYIFKFKGGL